MVTAIFQNGWGASLLGDRQDRADRGVPARADVRDPVRPVDGLRGVPRQPDLRGVAPPRATTARRSPTASPRPGARSPRRRRSWSSCSARSSSAASASSSCSASGSAGAVLIDAAIVRSVLVPALMLMLGDRNWKLPAFLERILPRVNIEGSVERVPARDEPLPTPVPEPARGVAGSRDAGRAFIPGDPRTSESPPHRPVRLEEEPVIVDCAHYCDGRRQHDGPMDLDRAATVYKDIDAGFVWLGLFEPTLEELQKVQARFGLHDLAVEDAQNLHLRPKVEQYNDGAISFVVIRTAQLHRRDRRRRVRRGERVHRRPVRDHGAPGRCQRAARRPHPARAAPRPACRRTQLGAVGDHGQGRRRLPAGRAVPGHRHLRAGGDCVHRIGGPQQADLQAAGGRRTSSIARCTRCWRR